MGQALYRKYRSKSLKEIVGQEHITDTLTEAIKSGRISHAYLLTGPRGVGKTSIARILAHEINGLPYDDQAHIDIIEIDAASNRRIDEIRELRDKIHVAPAIAKYKVYIIDEVHMLTREAFNALLKTLEEPPAHAIFILATTEAHKLPETITSRTQRYIFRPIEPTKAVAHLRDIAAKEGIKITDDALELVVEHGSGSFRDSISLLDQLGSSSEEIDLEAVQRVLGIAPAQAIQELLALVRHGQPTTEVYNRLASLIDQGYQPANIARQLARTLRGTLLGGAEVAVNDVALLNSLLDVPLSHDPEASLEVALISYQAVTIVPNVQLAAVEHKKAVKSTVEPVTLDSEEPLKLAATEAVVEPEIEPKLVAEIPTKTASEAKKPRLSTNNATLDPESWQRVLDSMKRQHNTLYGIVRMAQPDFSKPGTLTLAFNFAFHQKRANEAKNRKIIGDALTDVTGTSTEIICVHDSEAKAAQPVLGSAKVSVKAADATPDSSLSAISNIFGGVEMVE